MANNKQNYISVDLEDGRIHRSFSDVILGEGDIKGDIFGITVFDNGQPFNLSGGECYGYFIRPDNITLVIKGTVSSNTAYVELPEAAYVVPGTYTLSIKVSKSGKVFTLRIVDGTVCEQTTAYISDPASVLPSLEEFEELAEAVEEAAGEINTLTVEMQQITGTRYKLVIARE